MDILFDLLDAATATAAPSLELLTAVLFAVRTPAELEDVELAAFGNGL